ncbi:hypothetical protein [Vibrio fluminensis]|uniref:hypothetical protein n=1 Tax=Vibrio fluminensis TaxID=2783614 RepID=UPI0018887C0B|nr:hypothetical protein [Vibrio fluminensis]
MKKDFFLLNRNKHYFVVTGDVDVSKLVDCTLYATLSDLYEAAASAHNLSVDEIEGTELGFTFFDGKWVSNELMDIDDLETMSIEEYISNFLG